MLDPVRQNTKSKRFNFSESLLASRPVDHDSWKVRHLGDPAIVFLPFKLNGVLHEIRLAQDDSPIPVSLDGDLALSHFAAIFLLLLAVVYALRSIDNHPAG